MSELSLTTDDRKLADEMAKLYGNKDKSSQSENEREFLRLMKFKTPNQAEIRKLKLLIKLFRQEKRFLAVKAKTEWMLKREYDEKQKVERQLSQVVGRGLIVGWESESKLDKSVVKRFGQLRTYIFQACALELIEKKDWWLVQDKFLQNKRDIEVWLESDWVKSLEKADFEFFERLQVFFLDATNRIETKNNTRELAV